MGKTTGVQYSNSFFKVTRKNVPANGSMHAYFVVDKADAVAILPVTPKGRIILERQFRPAIGASIYEIPAGHIERGETPRHAALRELEEETGYRAGKLECVAVLYGSPGVLNEKIHLYIATNLTCGKRNPDPSESISLKEVSLRDALAMVDRGKAVDGKTMAAILYYARLASMRG